MTKNAADAAGFSVLELLIVAVMISVLVGFAITQIAQAKQNMTRANAVRELATYIEKARLDSVRRHATTSAQMAQLVLGEGRVFKTGGGNGNTMGALMIARFGATGGFLEPTFLVSGAGNSIHQYDSRATLNAMIMSGPSVLGIAER